ncbi:MAG: hypothetical protein JSW47_07200 [Phycisphaerales bacterium]|nr:MAG: hypothetical protein JSW47_07200 [Phycisphaerales bacterium]
MDAVVVYKANPESLQKVLGLLRKEGFNPTTLENRVSATDLHGAGRATYLISIAVPRNEARGAASVLRKWDKARQSEVSELTGKLAGPFILSTMIIAALAVILLLLGILFDAVALLAVVWIILFALFANADKIILKARRPKRR